MPPRFRPSRPGDEGPARALVFSVLREFGLAPDPHGVDADLDDLDAAYVRDGGMFEVLVDDDGAIVGTVGLKVIGHDPDGPVGELRKMYLHPEARGRGFGRASLERVIAHARARGFSRIELETHSVLADAIRLYRRHGFVPHDADPCSRCDGTMVLDLTPPGEA